jgi:KaiC/GvpD/RAD55 family RecA-like ATPase
MQKGKNLVFGGYSESSTKNNFEDNNLAVSTLKFSENQRRTGIDILDRILGGGLPSGFVVCIIADATSMAEVFLYQITQARRSYYFVTERRPMYVLKDIQKLGLRTDDIIVVDVYSEYYLNSTGEFSDNIRNERADTSIVQFTEYNLKKILAKGEQDVNIIFDTFTFYLNLNVNPGIIKQLINLIYETTQNLRCLSFLYGLSSARDRILEYEILNLSDVVFNIALEKKPDKVSNILSIPKIRGRAEISEIIRFKIEEGIQIDTTKDIV